jgi:hypothetical protein
MQWRGERSGVVAMMPSQCVALVVQLARQYAQMWLGFAQELGECARVIDSQGQSAGE